ncbi:MadN protein [hydrothermal vent metagenome]|uniref:MadN protein n=1 Tax=hydrothermal vent metagenome TaxID=652676 RepID=A0A3B1C7J1_9ZZZZ
MLYLLLVSLIWAFSFGLIKGNLVSLDSNFVAFVRLLISFLIFLPFLKIKELKQEYIWKLLLIGSIQYGIMYATYIYAFKYLAAYEVVLFTIFTPIYVNVINDLLTKKFHAGYFITALLAAIGTGIILNDKISSSNVITGFVLIQISNLAFAFGQVYYKRVMKNISAVKDWNIFALLYLGAVIVTFILSIFTTDFTNMNISSTQIYTLLYLGAIASGVGFFLWNYGVRKTNIGTVAIFNDLKIPLGVLVSIIFFGESAKIQNLVIGGLIVTAALVINEYRFNKSLYTQTTKERSK